MDGLVGDEAACFLKHLSLTWGCHYGRQLDGCGIDWCFALV